MCTQGEEQSWGSELLEQSEGCAVGPGCHPGRTCETETSGSSQRGVSLLPCSGVVIAGSSPS